MDPRVSPAGNRTEENSSLNAQNTKNNNNNDNNKMKLRKHIANFLFYYKLIQASAHMKDL